MTTKKGTLVLFCVLILFLSSCHENKPLANSQSILRISCENEPQTIDVRRARDLQTATLIHMLYEGLMRVQFDGQPAPAMAKAVIVSPDQKTYTFKLRLSNWSDGSLITANDFEQTWKSILDPQFPSPNAYQFYCIQGAQEAKEGKISTEKVGIYAPDQETLIVQLAQPTPYFLHLVSTHFFYPVHQSLRAQLSGTVPQDENQMITNGPFRIEKWKRHNELIAVPNDYYWDRSNVRLDQLSFIILDNPTALQLFQRGELEWTGSPLSTLSTDALASLKSDGQLEVLPGAGIFLFRINTESSPFKDPKMRRAFAMSLNRHDLVEHVLQGNQKPALRIIPPSFLENDSLFNDHDHIQAQKLFKEALQEQNLTLETLPPISIQYASGERSHKIAQVAQQQWKEILGVHVSLNNIEGKVFFNHLKNHDYQIGIGSWFADFRDPISFLEVFKRKGNGTNNTQWENPEYINLLDRSATTSNQMDRLNLFQQAEAIILNDMPIIPLFYASYNYLRKPYVKGVYFSELGYLDFKNAYLEDNH